MKESTMDQLVCFVGIVVLCTLCVIAFGIFTAKNRTLIYEGNQKQMLWHSTSPPEAEPCIGFWIIEGDVRIHLFRRVAGVFFEYSPRHGDGATPTLTCNYPPDFWAPLPGAEASTKGE